MEDIMVEQVYEIVGDIENIVKNFNKDGPSRKSKKYFEKKNEVVNLLKTKLIECNDRIDKEGLEKLKDYTETYAKGLKMIKWITDAIADGLLKIEEFHVTNPDVPLDSITLELLKIKPTPTPRDNEKEDETKSTDGSFFVEDNDEANAILKKLVKTQEGLIISANQQARNLDTNLKLTRGQIEYRIDRLKKTFEKIENTDMEIWSLASGSECFGYKHEIFFNVADFVENIVTHYHDELQQHQAKTTNQSTVKLPKLPEIGCPIFSGDYKKWLNFAQLFKELIHNRTDIGKVSKMLYLQENCQGEPLSLIRNLPLTDGNYDAAINILTERYNNKRLIANAHFEVMFDRPVIVKQSASKLKSLHDDVNESLQALNQMGLKTNEWDCIIIFLITRKLDAKTRLDFETSLAGSKTIPQLSTLMTFLRSQFSALESIESSSPEPSTPIKKHSFIVTTENCSLGCSESHLLHLCSKFKALSVAERYDHVKTQYLCLNCLRPNHKVQSCKFSPCLKCRGKHSTWLHIEKPTKDQTINSEVSRDGDPPISASLTTTNANKCSNYVLLATTMVSIKHKDGGRNVICRAILDSASQLNFISTNVYKKLGISGSRTTVEVEGIGKAKKGCDMKIDLKVSATSTDFSLDISDVMVLDSITSQHPSVPIDTKDFNMPTNMILADEDFYQPKEIGLLLGAGVVAQVLLAGNFSLGHKKPSLQNSKFGWVALGEVLVTQLNKYFCGIVSETNHNMKGSNIMKVVWENEYGEGYSKTRKKENFLCEKFFTRTSIRVSNGRFSVRLPFTKEPNLLGNSEAQALKRYFSMERKLRANSHLREEYHSFMKTYLEMGHMEEVRSLKTIGNQKYYLPHHYVLKPGSSTTKLRVVFDATSVTSTGLSLNDILAKGPKLQRDLVDILVRFRTYQFALCADIKMMFRQIQIHPSDQKYQLIFFRFDPTDPVKTYKLNTVTYGTTSAPYLSVKCLQQLASNNSEKYPLASKIIREEFYMDDMLTGSDNLEELMSVRKEIVNILASAGFELRKWASNESKILEEIASNECEDCDKSLKVLGVSWDTSRDNFLIQPVVDVVSLEKITKRYILTKISEIFDPLGLLNPVLVVGRLFLQDLWDRKLGWDEPISQEFVERWREFYGGLTYLKNIMIPRKVFLPFADSIELHAFCDASSIAYGAVVYTRSVSGDAIFTNLLCSKSRVVSVKKRQKTISMPRLELCAAVLLVELVDKVSKSLNKLNTVVYYTDSTTVIHWIHKNCNELKPFVSRRVATIQRLSQPTNWRYIKSKLNPADMISRGISCKKFLSKSYWFSGPEFLNQQEIVTDSFPNDPYDTSEDTVVFKSLLVARQGGILDLNINHKNNFDFLLGIVSNIVKFVYLKCNRKLDITWRDRAMELLVGCMQEEFEEDKLHLKNGHFVKPTSKLKTLSPFIDQSDLIRVGGRISKAEHLNYGTKHPWVLSYSHPYTYLLVKDFHQKYLHATPQALLYIIRQNFWPLRGRLLTKYVVNHCYRCFLLNPRSFEQVMGNLPTDRLTPQRPFLICGVDYIGPMKIHHKMRGRRPTKCYVSVFVCFVTKSLHIEIVSDLTANAFLAAFKRMIGRRGCPARVYSDNGSNFKCAARQIELNFESSEFNHFIATRNIDWSFIPARSPHMGGIWESAVRSIKLHYEKVVQYYTLTFEELQTVMVEIEAILNSRPLTPMSDDPRDLQVLTPGHFLIGEPLTALPESSNVKVVEVRKNWHAINELKKLFWNRWSNEYLTELQKRYKWNNSEFDIEPGTLVLLKDDDSKPLYWKRGRVTSCVKGDDNRIRVVNLKTEHGITSRTVHKICPIPLEEPLLNFEDESIGPKTNAKVNSLICRKFFLNICLIIMFFIPLVVAKPVFQNITDNSGLFFEDLGEARVILSKFNVVAFFDLDHYWVARDGISSAIVQQKMACQLADENYKNLTACPTIIEQLLRRWEQSEKLHRYIFKERRPKRALLKFAGALLHDVIGLMDEDTAKEYDRRIEESSKNQQFLVKTVEKMAILHNSTMNIIEENNHKIIDELSRINSAVLRLTTMLDVNDFRNFVTNSILAIEEFKDLQLGIWEAIRDVHTGIFNPVIIEPEQLMNLIDKVRSELPTILTFPSSDVFELMKFLKIKAFSTKNNILFEIEIPLVGTEMFTMFQVHPFPIIYEDYLVSIVPNLHYLLVNSMKDRYIEVHSGNDGHLCSKTVNIWLCSGINEVHHTEGVQACEIRQFIHPDDDSLKYCQIQFSVRRLVIIQLTTTNHWLVVEPGNEVFEMACKNERSKDTIHGRGILIVKNGCQIRTPSTTLLSYEDPTRNLSFVKSQFDLSLFLQRANNSLFLNSTELEHGPLLLQNLPRAPPTSELELPSHELHQFVVGYTSLFTALIICAIVLYLVRKYKWMISVLIPKPAPRRVADDNDEIL